MTIRKQLYSAKTVQKQGVNIFLGGKSETDLKYTKPSFYTHVNVH